MGEAYPANDIKFKREPTFLSESSQSEGEILLPLPETGKGKRKKKGSGRTGVLISCEEHAESFYSKPVGKVSPKGEKREGRRRGGRRIRAPDSRRVHGLGEVITTWKSSHDCTDVRNVGESSSLTDGEEDEFGGSGRRGVHGVSGMRGKGEKGGESEGSVEGEERKEMEREERGERREFKELVGGEEESEAVKIYEFSREGLADCALQEGRVIDDGRERKEGGVDMLLKKVEFKVLERSEEEWGLLSPGERMGQFISGLERETEERGKSQNETICREEEEEEEGERLWKDEKLWGKMESKSANVRMEVESFNEKGSYFFDNEGGCCLNSNIPKVPLAVSELFHKLETQQGQDGEREICTENYKYGSRQTKKPWEMAFPMIEGRDDHQTINLGETDLEKTGKNNGAQKVLSNVKAQEEERRGTFLELSVDDTGSDEVARYVERLEVKEAYMDMVADMEDVLLDPESEFNPGDSISARVRHMESMESQAMEQIKSASLNKSNSSLSTFWGSWANNASSISRQEEDVIDGADSWRERIVYAEVIGAKQIRGGVSLGDRVVGVKEHTVYIIKLKGEKKEWIIERRYRDFVSLCRIMNRELGLVVAGERKFLPEPWNDVLVECRNFFGNISPNVVERRSSLLQSCLRSALADEGSLIASNRTFLEFLSPSWKGFQQTSERLSNVFGSLPFSSSTGWTKRSTGGESVEVDLERFGTGDSEATRVSKLDNQNSSNFFSEWNSTACDVDAENLPAMSPSMNRYGRSETGGLFAPTLGKTIRLILDIPPRKTVVQQLHVQHYRCGGCYRPLNAAGSTGGIISGLTGGLGLGGISSPRLCEYTGQFFCGVCHVGEASLIPARVLRLWDFQPRKVSQLAKAYLDSIHVQPMLCVSAVNPLLYTRVPILARVRIRRRQLARLQSSLLCEAGLRLADGLGQRRYLLLDNDFFSLRELADFSLGSLAAVPGFLERMVSRLQAHIRQDCATCQAVGVPCAAGSGCMKGPEKIFTFEADVASKCPLCKTLIHKVCLSAKKRCQVCSKENLNFVEMETAHGSGGRGRANLREDRMDKSNDESDVLVGRTLRTSFNGDLKKTTKNVNKSAFITDFAL